MLKTDINSVIEQMNQTLFATPYDHHIKVHKMYQPRPVNPTWQIEKDRIIDDIHLMYIIKGKGTYLLGQEAVPMKKGQLYIVSNDYPHGAVPDQEDLVHIFSMRFGIYDNHTKSYLPHFFKEPFGLLVVPELPEIIQDKLAMIYQDYLEDTKTKDATASIYLKEILLSLKQNLPSLDLHTRISQVTKTINQKHGSKITVTDLANQVNLSTKQFTRLFVKANKTTPHQYIISARINHAKYLLEETNLTIKTISQELAYTDAFTFSRQFKKETGQSPTDFRG